MLVPLEGRAVISIYFGVAGSGKSLLQVNETVQELRLRRRNVVTNCALNLGKLQQYMDANYPEACCDVANRVRILTRDETKTFWRFRGSDRMTWQPNEHNGYSDYCFTRCRGENGVLYIIDEAGASGFDARGWLDEIQSQEGRQAKRGTEAVWYLDQHRKLGDDVIASANGRHPTTIAKPFRDKAEVFVRLRNGYSTRYGPFRAKQSFTAYHYYSDPDSKAEPFRTVDFKLDVAGLASLYDTASGMGIQGTVADTQRKRGGLPFWTVWVGAAAIAIGAFVLPVVASKLFGKHAKAAVVPSAAAMVAVSAPPPRTREVSPNVGTDDLPVAVGFMDGPDGKRVALKGEGWYQVAGFLSPNKVLLADGRQVLLHGKKR